MQNGKTLPDRIVTIAGREYPLRYGQNALFKLEQHLYQQEAERVARGGTPQGSTVRDEVSRSDVFVALQGLELLRAMPNRMSMHLIFWAGLEGGRIKNGTREKPWTVDEAGELIDTAGGVDQVTPVTMLAYSEAFPGRFTKEYLARLEELDTALKNGQAAKVNPEPQTTDQGPGSDGSSKE